VSAPIPLDLKNELKGIIGKFFITGGRYHRYVESDRGALEELISPFLERIGRAEARNAALMAALRGLLDGLDDYWATLPEGKAALQSARAALAGEPHDGQGGSQ